MTSNKRKHSNDYSVSDKRREIQKSNDFGIYLELNVINV